MSEVQPLRRCLPEIVSSIRSTFERAELRRRFLENKQKDLRLKKERIRVNTQDKLKGLESLLDEL